MIFIKQDKTNHYRCLRLHRNHPGGIHQWLMGSSLGTSGRPFHRSCNLGRKTRPKNLRFQFLTIRTFGWQTLFSSNSQFELRQVLISGSPEPSAADRAKSAAISFIFDIQKFSLLEDLQSDFKLDRALYWWAIWNWIWKLGLRPTSSKSRPCHCMT